MSGFTHTGSFALPARVVDAFAAWTDAAALERWFAQHARVDLREGGELRFWGRYTLGTPEERDATQRITRLEIPVRLGFTWTIAGVPTQVELSLAADEAAEPAGARLTVRHVIEGALPYPRPAALIDDAWRLAVSNLLAHLAGGDGIVRPDQHARAHAIVRTVDVAAPASSCYCALMHPAALNRWVASAAAVEPREGGLYSYGWRYEVGGRQVAGGPTRILELVPSEKLAHDWGDWRGDPDVPPTRVTWTIEPTERGARVTLVHDGFARAEDMSDYPYGWTSFLGALQADVERHARPFELAQAVGVLERTPEILRAWLRGMDARWLECDEGPGTFSPREVVGHLVHGETTDWMPRVRRILQHGEDVPFEPFDRFAHRELYANLSVNELCARFARLRRRNLAELRELPLDEAALARRGRHPALGTVTLRELLATWVVHDLTHIRQIARTMAKRYQVEVGPWKAYLPILGE